MLPGTARYDSMLNDDQHRDVRNLLLFCGRHGAEVDAKEVVYAVEVLHRWKSQREAGHASALKRLREAAPPGLRDVVAQSSQKHDGQLLAAISRLEETDSEAAGLMRGLLDELAESYARQRGSLDPGMVNDFYMATRQLGRMQDILEEFVAAVHLSVRWKPLNDPGGQE
jgi:hypothetical protein